jgi:hypothetical protein
MIRVLAAVLTATAATLTLPAHTATAATLTLPAHAAITAPGQPACGMAQRLVRQSASGIWTLSRPNPFGYPGRYCITPAEATGFRVDQNMPRNGDVRAYPFTGVGCAYDLCSKDTDLPKRVGREGGATSSWAWRGSPAGEWNASYDLWFDMRDQISTQDNGAELMIWLRTMPRYRGGKIVTIGGHRYEFMTWRAGHGGKSWNYIQFRTLSTTRTVTGLKLWPFIQFAIRHRLIRWGWWLTSVHAGFEIWSGGTGLTTERFDAHV